MNPQVLIYPIVRPTMDLGARLSKVPGARSRLAHAADGAFGSQAPDRPGGCVPIGFTAQARCALASLLVTITAACGPDRGPQTDSQTNWLRACQVDADCGELQCLCGACTRACSAEATCAGLASSSCVLAEEAGAIALCGGGTPSSRGFCLPRCQSGPCGSGTMCVAAVCSPTPEPSARVVIDTSTRYQTLVGFGATEGYVITEVVQHPRKSALYQAMFADLGLDFLRLRNHYGYSGEDDFASTAEIVDAATTSLGRKPTVLLTSWSPPASLKANGAIRCEGNPDTCTLTKLSGGGFDYAGFAAYWRASLDTYAGVGIAPDYIGIQNNPNYVPAASSPGEACKFLPTEGTATVSVDGSNLQVTYPGFAEALAAVTGQLAGLASVPKIAAPEVTGVGSVAEYLPYLDFSRVDAIAHHMYGLDPAAMDSTALVTLGELGKQYQRPLFQTEMQSESFATAVLMHYALTVEGASAYLQNDFTGSASLDDSPNALIDLDAEDFTVQSSYHAMRQYSFFTDPGWVRVAATPSATALLASAWLSPAGDALTVVLANDSASEIDAQIDFGQQKWASSELTRTAFDGVERSATLGVLSAAGILTVPSHAMVTVALRR